jgi:hypothetical protein
MKKYYLKVFLIECQQILALLQQCDRFHQQVIEVHAVGLALLVLVELAELQDALGDAVEVVAATGTDGAPIDISTKAAQRNADTDGVDAMLAALEPDAD